jgi:hypothetical protein
VLEKTFQNLKEYFELPDFLMLILGVSLALESLESDSKDGEPF